MTGLQVENIVVLGHARCGGVEAFIDRFLSHSDSTGFISEWMSMLRPAWAEVLASDRWKGPIELRQALEHASIRHSIENLKTFPFIQERIDAGDLKLHGAYFDIATGQLLSLDRGTRAFQPVA